MNSKTPWKVATVSGYAGGSNPRALVTLSIATESPTVEHVRAAVQELPALVKALEDLFEHCAMVHKHWGEGCNQKEADAAIADAQAVLRRLAR